MKLDISRLTRASQDYPYQISSGLILPPASIYPSGQQYLASGGNTGLMNGSPYTGHPTDQRDLVPLSYATSITCNPAYYGYNEAVSDCNQYPTQWNQQAPIFHETSPNQMTQWNSGYDPGYATYEAQAPRLPLRTSSLATQMPITSQSQLLFPHADAIDLTSSERALPNNTEAPSNSNADILFPLETGDRLPWTTLYGSRQNSEASQTSSQELPAIQQSFDQTGAAPNRQQDGLSRGTAIHAYPHRVLEPSHTSSGIVPSLPAAPLAYGNQQLSDRYHYNFAPARSTEPSNPVFRPNSSIGNHSLRHLPIRGRCATLGDLQYEIHDGVRRAASRIAVETGGSRRVPHKR